MYRVSPRWVLSLLAALVVYAQNPRERTIHFSDLPPGIAVNVPAKNQIVIQVHYINATAKAVFMTAYI